MPLFVQLRADNTGDLLSATPESSRVAAQSTPAHLAFSGGSVAMLPTFARRHVSELQPASRNLPRQTTARRSGHKPGVRRMETRPFLAHVPHAALERRPVNPSPLSPSIPLPGHAPAACEELCARADYEVIIVGGGIAGLSAALILGRCRRRVLICDDEQPRNRRSRGVHGFPTRDGTPPAELLRIAREQLAPYSSLKYQNVHVVSASRVEGEFRVTLADGVTVTSRKLLLATGLTDVIPEIDGFCEFYGRGVYVCPICDGWEMQGKRIVVYGRTNDLFGYALELLFWTDTLVVCTDRSCCLDEAVRCRLSKLQIEVRDERVVRLQTRDGKLSAVELEGGDTIPCDALFFNPCQRQHSNLAEILGDQPNRDGVIEVLPGERAKVKGLFVAGNASAGLQLAVQAAAEGVRAAYEIVQELLEEKVGPC